MNKENEGKYYSYLLSLDRQNIEEAQTIEYLDKLQSISGMNRKRSIMWLLREVFENNMLPIKKDMKNIKNNENLTHEKKNMSSFLYGGE